MFCGGTEPGKRTPEGLWLLRFERAAGCIFVADVPRTRSLNGYLRALAERYAKLRGGVGVIDTVKTRAIADFLPEVREFLWLNNP